MNITQKENGETEILTTNQCCRKVLLLTSSCRAQELVLKLKR